MAAYSPTKGLKSIPTPPPASEHVVRFSAYMHGRPAFHSYATTVHTRCAAHRHMSLIARLDGHVACHYSHVIRRGTCG